MRGMRIVPAVLLLCMVGLTPAAAEMIDDLNAFEEALRSGDLSAEEIRSRSNGFLRRWGEIQAREQAQLPIPPAAARQIYDRRETIVAECKRQAARFVRRNQGSRGGPWDETQLYGILNTGSWVRDRTPSFRKDVDFTIGTTEGADGAYLDFKDAFENYFQRMTGASADSCLVGVMPKSAIRMGGAAGSETNQYQGGARRFVDIYSVGYGSAERILPTGEIRTGYAADDFFIWANEAMPRMGDDDAPGLAQTMWAKYQKLAGEYAGEALARETAKVVTRSHYAKRVVLHARAGRPMVVGEAYRIEQGGGVRGALSRRMQMYGMTFDDALRHHLAEGRALVEQNASNLQADYRFGRGTPTAERFVRARERSSNYEREPQLGLDRDRFRAKLRSFIEEKVREAVQQKLHEIRDAAMDEVHHQVNEIWREVLATTDLDEKLQEFRGDVDAVVQDFLDNHETIRFLYDFYHDERSWEIIQGLGEKWDHAQDQLDKILGAKGEIDALPDDADPAEYARILRDWGVEGPMVDRFERYEQRIRGALDDYSDHIEVFKILYQGFEGNEPGGPLIALFTIMENYGGRVPVLGAFIEAYGTVAKGFLEAALGLGKKIRERAQHCVGEGTTQAMRDNYNTTEERNARFTEQFPGLTACPSPIDDVYEQHGGDTLFFWTGGNWIAGRDGGGGISTVQEIIDFLAEAVSPELAGRTGDIGLIAKIYNVEEGFREVYQGTIDDLTEVARRVASMEHAFADSPYPVETLWAYLERETHYERHFKIGGTQLPFADAVTILAERYLYNRAVHPGSDRAKWMEELPEQMRAIRLFVIDGTVVGAVGGGDPKPVPDAGVETEWRGARLFPDCLLPPTDAEGGFTVIALPAESDNEIRIHARLDTLASETLVVNDAVMNAQGDPAAAVRRMGLPLRLEAPPGEIVVHVEVEAPPAAEGEDPAPSPEPQVTLLQGDRPVRNGSGTDVTFSDLAPGAYEVRAVADGYRADAATVTLESGASEKVSLDLESMAEGETAWTIVGRVIDLAGDPVDAAAVDAGAHTVTLDGNGGFTIGPITNPEAGLTVTVTAVDGDRTASAEAAYAGESTSSLEITLVGDVEITISGRVVDADGRPLSPALVVAGTVQSGSSSDGTFAVPVVVTGGQGIFEVSASVTAAGADGDVPVGSDPVTVTFEPGTIEYAVGDLVVPVKQPIEVTVSGRAIDVHGVPVGGASVLFRAETVVTGADGGFVFAPVWMTTDETATVEASIGMADGTTAAATPVSRQVDGPAMGGFVLTVPVEQAIPIVVSGRVVSLDGYGVSGVSVTGPQGVGPAATDGDGRFTLPPYDGVLGDGQDVTAAYTFPDGQVVSGSARVVPQSDVASVTIGLAVEMEPVQDDPDPGDAPPGDDPGDLPDGTGNAVDDTLDGSGDPGPDDGPEDGLFDPDDLGAGTDPDDTPPRHGDDPGARAGQAAQDAGRPGRDPVGALLDAALSGDLGGRDPTQAILDGIANGTIDPNDAAAVSTLIQTFDPNADTSRIDALVDRIRGQQTAGINGSMDGFWDWWNGVLDDRAAREQAAAEARAAASQAFLDAFLQGLQQAQGGPQGGGQGTIDPDSGLTDVTVDSRTITIAVWDHGQIDGDIINILHNGTPIHSGLELTGSPQSFTVNLMGGRDTIEVQAVNEGSVSPNTASISISNVVQGNSNQVYSLNQATAGAFNIFLQ